MFNFGKCKKYHSFREGGFWFISIFSEMFFKMSRYLVLIMDFWNKNLGAASKLKMYYMLITSSLVKFLGTR